MPTCGTRSTSIRADAQARGIVSSFAKENTQIDRMHACGSQNFVGIRFFS